MLTIFRRNSISGHFAIGMASIAVVSSVLLWCVWAYQRHRAFENETANERNAFREAQRAVIKSEVDAARELLSFNHQRQQAGVRAALKNRVEQAHTIAENIWNKYGIHLPNAECREMVAEALRPLRFHDGKGYFFMVDLNGRFILNANQPVLEGRMGLDLHDPGGLPFVSMMVDVAKTDGEGFVNYSFAKPGTDSIPQPKISFVKYFKPGGFLIGTGEYWDDIENDAKLEAVERITAMRFGEQGYVFALAYDSTMLAHRAQPLLVRRKMLLEESVLLRELFPRMMDVSRETGSGFLEYVWPKPGGGESNKVTYVARFPEWGWLLGAGFHTDELEDAIASRRARLFDALLVELSRMGLLLCAVVGVSLLVARHFAKKTEKDLKLFEEFFEKAAESQTSIAEPMAFTEFDSIALAANRMVAERARIQAEKEELEARLLQKRNLETLGTLAGGIAHDFNNILSAVLGYAELAERNPGNAPQVKRYSAEIIKAASRARDLVRQILAFSRQSPMERMPILLGQLVEDTLDMMRASLPATVEIVADLAPDMVVYADPTQLHQLVLNLCTNAGSAMKESGGRLNVVLAGVAVDPELLARLPELKEGPHARLSISDQGPGIAPEIMDRIFDPFFTTTREGSGLGLSVVHSIVRSHRGAIIVESAPNQGATFTVYLPLSLKEPSPTVAREKADPALGSERILFVDDEETLVELAQERLKQLGYAVSAFANPLEALEAFSAAPQSFDLLITDMTMPKLTGDNLAAKILEIRPGFPIILCTGYSESLTVDRIARLGAIAVLMKPVTLAAIAQKIREVLDIGK